MTIERLTKERDEAITIAFRLYRMFWAPLFDRGDYPDRNRLLALEAEFPILRDADAH